MSAAKAKVSDPRGLKRICLECGARFYDMNKRPIVCPSCDTEFTGEIKVKTRRAKAAAADDSAGQVDKKTAKDDTADEDDEDEDEDEEAQIVSLDDLETTEKSTDDDDEVSVDLDSDDDMDDMDIDEDDDDLGSLEDLEPDADVPDEDEDDESKD